ncbi:MAG: SIS domain-containing protein [Phycisphaerales bacterium]|nr:SIS domain-containing protein [Phycisphaerales bacterium]
MPSDAIPPLIQSLREARAALEALLADPALSAFPGKLAAALAAAFKTGNKVLICGNGGSACDAMHFAEELTGRFRADRPPLPAIACVDIGHITCTANDYGFDEVFARWVTALGTRGDVLIVLSTSGNSENVIRAATAGKLAGLTTVSLLGKGGGRLRGTCDLEMMAPGVTADRIQELHMLVLHTAIEGAEREMFPHLGT